MTGHSSQIISCNDCTWPHQPPYYTLRRANKGFVTFAASLVCNCLHWCLFTQLIYITESSNVFWCMNFSFFGLTFWMQNGFCGQLSSAQSVIHSVSESFRQWRSSVCHHQCPIVIILACLKAGTPLCVCGLGWEETMNYWERGGRGPVEWFNCSQTSFNVTDDDKRINSFQSTSQSCPAHWILIYYFKYFISYSDFWH